MAEKNDNRVNLTVVTPYHCFYEEQVSSVSLPSLDGELGIMSGHTPIVVALKPGVVNVRIGDEVKHFTVSEGFAEIGQHIVLVVCNSAEWPDDIKVRKLSDSYKECIDEIARIKNSDDSVANKYALKEINDRLARVKARIKLVSLYGNDQQKERLTELGLDII